jgi:hypothetical protein
VLVLIFFNISRLIAAVGWLQLLQLQPVIPNIAMIFLWMAGHAVFSIYIYIYIYIYITISATLGRLSPTPPMAVQTLE